MSFFCFSVILHPVQKFFCLIYKDVTIASEGLQNVDLGWTISDFIGMDPNKMPHLLRHGASGFWVSYKSHSYINSPFITIKQGIYRKLNTQLNSQVSIVASHGNVEWNVNINVRGLRQWLNWQLPIKTFAICNCQVKISSLL